MKGNLRDESAKVNAVKVLAGGGYEVYRVRFGAKRLNLMFLGRLFECDLGSLSGMILHTSNLTSTMAAES